MPLANYLPVRDDNANVAPGNIRTDESKLQQIINSIRQIMADLSGSGLTSIGATLGFVTQTAVGVFTQRTLQAGGGIVITNPAGTAGDPTIAVSNGSMVDSVHATYSTNANLTTIMPTDDTIPLITEGTEILSASISPKTNTNKLRCRFSGEGALSAAVNISYAMFQGSTCIDAAYASPTANVGDFIGLETEFTPGATASVTISVRVGPGSAGTLRMNGTSAGRIMGGAANATLVVEEIKA